ncbi:MAG: hypothetical protein K2H85_11895, partial [Allobaculum sp.]|nr:hypothetical protein [Allobaculum sp.]
MAQNSIPTRILYTQNFESVSSVEDTGWTFGGNSMNIATDELGKFIQISLGQYNGRSANLTWGKEIFFENGDPEKSLLIDGKYRIKYDFCIEQGSNNQYNGCMTVYTDHAPITNQPYRNPWNPEGYWQNYLFDMSQVNGESMGFAVNGGTVETVNEDGTVSYSIDYSDPSILEQSVWYTVNLDVDVNGRTVDYSVASLEGSLLKQGQLNVPQTNVNGYSISMYAEGLYLMLARYSTVYDIDNIVISSEGKQLPLADGDDFQYQGIWYTVLDSATKTCKTKEGYFDSDNASIIPGNKCEGNINIPAVVS